MAVASGSRGPTALILARDEERTIEEAVRGALAHCDRVVVMDGHSSDRTAAVAAAAGAEVHSDPGRGKGSAIRAGLEILDSEIVVLMDADGSHDPGAIPRLVAPLLADEAELCVGSRFAGGSDELAATLPQLVRMFGNVAMNVAINRRWRVELTDTLNGFRAVRRSIALSVGLREDTHTIEQEMVMKLLQRGYRVVNVPVHEYKRRYGVSHIDIWRQWPRFVWCVLRHIVNRRRPR